MTPREVEDHLDWLENHRPYRVGEYWRKAAQRVIGRVHAKTLGLTEGLGDLFRLIDNMATVLDDVRHYEVPTSELQREAEVTGG